MMSPNSPSASWLRPAVKYRAPGSTFNEPVGKRSPHSPGILRGPPGLQLAEELVGGGCEGVDAAVPEVAHQEVAGKGAEGVRGRRHPPGRVQPSLAG